jgi:microcystin-dependent protein
MKISTFLILAGTAGLFLVALPADAQMNYQGRLTDAAGDPVPGPQASLTFSLWDASTLGNKVWGDFQVTADLIDGRFNVVLGPMDTDGPPRDIADAFGGDRYLEIQVESDAPLPRQQVLAAPTALFATNAGEAVHADHATDADHATTADNVGGANEIHYLNPAGMMAPFAGSSAPSGWLSCDGSAVKSSDYPGLYAAIGTAWGDGTNHQGVLEDPADPDTDFNLPDLRGMFLRGSGAHGSQQDAAESPFDGSLVGTYQSDTFQGHQHRLEIRVASGYTGGGGITSGTLDDWNTIRDYFSGRDDTIIALPPYGDPRVGSETKPASYSVLYIIKH